MHSENLSTKLQADLAQLKTLIPAAALISDGDSVPGLHCPIGDLTFDKTKDSNIVLAMRGRQTFKMIFKEIRPVNLIRMRLHYLNFDEKVILRIIRTRFEYSSGISDFNISVSQRCLNVRLHNTWMTFGRGQSINMAPPVKQNGKRHTMEACANLKLEHLAADPMLCLLF